MGLFNSSASVAASIGGTAPSVPLRELYAASSLSADILSVSSTKGYRGSRILFELSGTQCVAIMGNKACVFDIDGTIGSTLTLQADSVIFAHQYATDPRKFLLVYDDGVIEQAYFTSSKTLGYQTQFYANWKTDLTSTISGKETTACAFDEEDGLLIIVSHDADANPLKAGLYTVSSSSATLTASASDTTAGASTFTTPNYLSAQLSLNVIARTGFFLSTQPTNKAYAAARITYTGSSITINNKLVDTGTAAPSADAETNIMTIGGDYGVVFANANGTPANDVFYSYFNYSGGTITRTETTVPTSTNSSTLVCPIENVAPVINSGIVFFGGLAKALVNGCPVLLSGAATLPSTPVFEALALRNGKGLAIAYQDSGSTLSKVKLWTV